MKLFANSYTYVFHVLYMFLGLMFSVSIFLLMLRLNINKWIATVLTTLFVVSPQVILYENILFYSYPTAVFLLISALLLNQFLTERKDSTGFAFFISIMCIVLLRSSFHLFWFLLIVLVLFKLLKKERLKIIKLALLPFLIVLLVYGKNYLLTGSFTTSSTWFGFQFATMNLYCLSNEEANDLVKEGKVSISTFNEVANLYSIGSELNSRVELKRAGVPVIDNLKNSNGTPNFNNYIYLISSRKYLKEALEVFKGDPEYYFRSLKRACILYFFPGPTDTPFVNRAVIKGYEDLFNWNFTHLNKINDGKLYSYYLWASSEFKNLKWDRLSIALYSLTAGLLMLLIGFSVWLIIWYWARKQDIISSLTLAFIVGNIFYLTIISNVFSSFGNNRYRFALDAFYLILFGLLINGITQRFIKNNNDS
ncbi:MAG: hypothetical protein KKD07_08660 [Candidatus Omnitrophica bacterium]|nr:hypothetical protein [Candidatus Omnitrophota bacterium]MBU1996357.1 hypothetical protein [Candidatus Omnitrophota bacterium]MBU4334496.1 hypothetical protein [Candidatus Omnitrophota bacterium]